MVSIALLGRNYQNQISANPDGLTGIEVVWNGDDRHLLQTGGVQARVLVADMDSLGADPVMGLDRLRQALTPELTLVVYRFAKRELLDSLQSDSIRVLQGPLSLASMRSQMLSLIVRDVFATGKTAEFRICPTCGTRVPQDQIAV